ncbi:hypothetical protein Nmel_015199 [Mimus melanotis]
MDLCHLMLLSDLLQFLQSPLLLETGAHALGSRWDFCRSDYSRLPLRIVPLGSRYLGICGAAHRWEGKLLLLTAVDLVFLLLLNEHLSV